MKLRTKLLTTVLILAGVTGCSGKMVLMKNEKGDIQKCEVSTASAMTTGMWMVNRDINRCVTQLEEAGYSRVTAK